LSIFFKTCFDTLTYACSCVELTSLCILPCCSYIYLLIYIRGYILFSLFLDLLAGYGYKPWRSFLAYLLVITAFATVYFMIEHTIGPVLSPLGAFVFSMTSFHGRGFFPGGIQLDDPLTVLAALEAFVELLIEVTFIATLTQRLFGK
jgi:hypothetical protein